MKTRRLILRHFPKAGKLQIASYFTKDGQETVTKEQGRVITCCGNGGTMRKEQERVKCHVNQENGI
ncbi:MAG: hypothetical protein AB1330_03540 [Bacillota bacterium]